MKPDGIWISEILGALAEHPKAVLGPDDVLDVRDFVDPNSEKYDYHVLLLEEREFIEVGDLGSTDGRLRYPKRLTWKGAKPLDANPRMSHIKVFGRNLFFSPRR